MTTHNKMQQIYPQNEKSTKTKILDVAIDLFAQKGFDATSMLEIAQAVGVKKASLYAHFSSKDEILEKILEYPLNRLGTPVAFETEQLITSMGLEKFLSLAGKKFMEWMEDPHMEKIWRIILIEIYHNKKIKAFYSKFINFSQSYWESIFSVMKTQKLVRPIDPKILANEYLSFYIACFADYFLLRYDEKLASFLDYYGNQIMEHALFVARSIQPSRGESGGI